MVSVAMAKSRVNEIWQKVDDGSFKRFGTEVLIREQTEPDRCFSRLVRLQGKR
jgi:hypothetical protein